MRAAKLRAPQSSCSGRLVPSVASCTAVFSLFCVRSTYLQVQEYKGVECSRDLEHAKESCCPLGNGVIAARPLRSRWLLVRTGGSSRRSRLQAKVHQGLRGHPEPSAGARSNLARCYRFPLPHRPRWLPVLSVVSCPRSFLERSVRTLTACGAVASTQLVSRRYLSRFGRKLCAKVPPQQCRVSRCNRGTECFL